VLPYAAVREACGGFASLHELGRGGFGVVYKGQSTLTRDGTAAYAVKKLERSGMVNVERGNIGDKLQPRNINLSFTNNSNVAIDVIIFTFYSDQIIIDVETGIVTKYFFFRSKYCYENIIIFKFINGQRNFEGVGLGLKPKVL